LAPQVTIVYNFSTKSLKLQASLWTVKAGSIYIYIYIVVDAVFVAD
jgi:hypothetical protein